MTNKILGSKIFKFKGSFLYPVYLIPYRSVTLRSETFFTPSEHIILDKRLVNRTRPVTTLTKYIQWSKLGELLKYFIRYNSRCTTCSPGLSNNRTCSSVSTLFSLDRNLTPSPKGLRGWTFPSVYFKFTIHYFVV